ncbi:hypothetical protein DI383_14315 [Flavobacteriaceae bacterium LYZ1037]|nr:hypothetical protein DI383_14315 [Flavobacteriaceae bacterium LYZ1037]
MDYTGNIFISLSIFIVTFLISYYLIKKTRLKQKALGKIDLIWQATLVLGIITATAGVRKYQSEWKYEKSMSYISHWYKDIQSELNRYRVEAENGLKKAKVYKWESENEYSYLIEWYDIQHNKFIKNETSVLGNLNTEDWEKLKSEIEKVDSTSIRFYDEANQNILIKLKWIDEEIYQTASYKSDRFDTNLEGLIFMIGPWILSLVLGIRMAKTRYSTFILTK